MPSKSIVEKIVPGSPPRGSGIAKPTIRELDEKRKIARDGEKRRKNCATREAHERIRDLCDDGRVDPAAEDSEEAITKDDIGDDGMRTLVSEVLDKISLEVSADARSVLVQAVREYAEDIFEDMADERMVSGERFEVVQKRLEELRGETEKLEEEKLSLLNSAYAYGHTLTVKSLREAVERVDHRRGRVAEDDREKLKKRRSFFYSRRGRNNVDKSGEHLFST